jgi:hypothetical protein
MSISVLIYYEWKMVHFYFLGYLKVSTIFVGKVFNIVSWVLNGSGRKCLLGFDQCFVSDSLNPDLAESGSSLASNPNSFCSKTVLNPFTWHQTNSELFKLEIIHFFLFWVKFLPSSNPYPLAPLNPDPKHRIWQTFAMEERTKSRQIVYRCTPPFPRFGCIHFM